jgi:hypothetical protein
MRKREMFPLSPLELHPLLHPPLGIQLKIIFSLNLSCLGVGVTFARNTTRKPREVKKSSIDNIFGKRPETTIVFLDFVEPEDVMIINTRNKSYAPKGKYDPPRNSSSLSSSSPAAIT